MKHLTIKHFLTIYTDRLKMQEEGITNPTSEMIIFTKKIIALLSTLPEDDIVKLTEMNLIDENGTVLINFTTKKVFKKQ
ncbi:hypothetical protein H1R17_06255 [Flavobacterium sp. xlx-214]|uniref:hypothetical protein n=1 Tax=unclassified Flavobacterium TaxID=196869 RepID=UPI0013D83970|nr:MULTISPECIES: hypothetical protein [unclassified Flavobacterium]MBA5792946.1 hypothetical protein [Flavobacterium sp. xlx-221]QMI84720.1 hypothetical protein H1R17_06255 [Flavobacterium sp. xlx-214]